MEAAELIRRSRAWAGLTQRQLAERAGTSAPAISLYESGDRVPRVDTLQRIVEATGAEFAIAVELEGTQRIDLDSNARSFADVLDLADHLPRESTRELRYPILRDAAR